MTPGLSLDAILPGTAYHDTRNRRVPGVRGLAQTMINYDGSD